MRRLLPTHGRCSSSSRPVEVVLRRQRRRAIHITPSRLVGGEVVGVVRGHG